MSYSKKGEGFLQITKGSYWSIYSYFKNLQLNYKQENLGRHFPTGIWKEYNAQGKLLKEEDMDLLYDDRPEFINKKIKLISIRDIAAKLNTRYQKNLFSDNNFCDIKISIDPKTNKWIYTISFYDDQKGNILNYFHYDAHNGNFIRKSSITLTKDIILH
ncbi:hypothetical protein BOQ62_06135 [Chryseobacterium sp. CH21]|uniref:hypothetical protein n=1 Tax=Chryseobacterium sp. CH21 TaxID=713556 RepID=UPI00100AADE3|nr:hypothetical protein [Chryseobacterium sp. CH21]RXM40531.1 hypothetical protein BOQ62_06135 [Chryseobacterium sp. CH21]